MVAVDLKNGLDAALAWISQTWLAFRWLSDVLTA
jgi:hypothetical protein